MFARTVPNLLPHAKLRANHHKFFPRTKLPKNQQKNKNATAKYARPEKVRLVSQT